MDVLENIKQAIQLLRDNEEYYQQLNGENGLISTCDKKIDYWEHYIEFNSLNLKQLYRVYKEIKNLRQERRKYKNDAELIRTFKEHEQKMMNAQNREMLLIQVCKINGKQKNAKYSYSAYTEEEKNKILGIKEKGD